MSGVHAGKSIMLYRKEQVAFQGTEPEVVIDFKATLKSNVGDTNEWMTLLTGLIDVSTRVLFYQLLFYFSIVVNCCRLLLYQTFS